jgi:hypothetical protein
LSSSLFLLKYAFAPDEAALDNRRILADERRVALWVASPLTPSPPAPSHQTKVPDTAWQCLGNLCWFGCLF